MIDNQTHADKEAVDALRHLALTRQRHVRRPAYINSEHEYGLKAGQRCVWLWYPYEGASDPIPVRAIVLQRNKTQAQVRVEFAIGPVIVWVGISRLRPLKNGR